ncbi:MAG: 4-alpha-glucanotransferase [Clostridia bacterium]|nr:4-alpha-glucanotransferase [Clostridia bacterium]
MSEKRSGILMPVFSLPSDYSIGSLGKEAIDFIDFLSESGQTVWQILPIGPTLYKEANSPYKTMSPFAGNPLLISLEDLVERELLKETEIETLKREDIQKIDYKNLINEKNNLLYLAAKRGLKKKTKEYFDFIEENQNWIFEYSKYLSLIAENKRYFSETLQKEIIFIEYLFFSQFSKIKKYANEKNILLYGDIPFFEAYDSHRVYFHSDKFKLNENGSLYKVAGVPPDAFSDKGQLWGNPVYDFEKIEKGNFKFIYDKFEFAFKCYDIVRLDHFRGFESYYEIDYDSNDASFGMWRKGPGRKFIDLIKSSFGTERIIAENLGYITDEVRDLMNYSEFYSMSVLQFAFGDNIDESSLPENQNVKNCYYTGTHDNPTAKSFLESKKEHWFLQEKLREFFYENDVYSFISYAMSAKSKLFIAPMSDYLLLGEEGRINVPGTTANNWETKYKKSAFNDNLSNKIFNLCKEHKRLI